MKVINLYGGPGSGKSTTAAGLFHKMKKEGLNVELVTEYAKDKVWDNSVDVLLDQLYVFAKQNRKLDRLKGKVDYVITDSPILLSIYYGDKYGRHSYNFECFKVLALEVYNSYDNYNVFITRTKPFKQVGRLGSEEGANQADVEIREMLGVLGVKYTEMTDADQLLSNIYNTVMSDNE